MTLLKTKVFRLSLEEGQAIVDYYQMYANHKTPITQEQINLIEELKRKIDLGILELDSTGKKGALVRLSSRSPKDAALLPGNGLNMLKKKNIE